MDHAAIECVRCGVHLPLKRDLTADHPEASWVCANCGWQMPGVFDPAARDGISSNVAPVPSSGLDTDLVEDNAENEPLLKQLLVRCLPATPGN